MLIRCLCNIAIVTRMKMPWTNFFYQIRNEAYFAFPTVAETMCSLECSPNFVRKKTHFVSRKVIMKRILNTQTKNSLQRCWQQVARCFWFQFWVFWWVLLLCCRCFVEKADSFELEQCWMPWTTKTLPWKHLYTGLRRIKLLWGGMNKVASFPLTLTDERVLVWCEKLGELQLAVVSCFHWLLAGNSSSATFRLVNLQSRVSIPCCRVKFCCACASSLCAPEELYLGFYVAVRATAAGSCHNSNQK